MYRTFLKTDDSTYELFWFLSKEFFFRNWSCHTRGTAYLWVPCSLYLNAPTKGWGFESQCATVTNQLWSSCHTFFWTKKNSLRLSRLSAMFLIQLYAYKVSKIHVYGTLYIYNKSGYVFCFFYILSTYQGCSKVFDHRYFITCNKQGKIRFISTITPHIKLINPLWSKNTPRNMKLHWSASLLEIRE